MLSIKVLFGALCSFLIMIACTFNVIAKDHSQEELNIAKVSTKSVNKNNHPKNHLSVKKNSKVTNQVQVSIRVIEAKNDLRQVDPRLADLKDKFNHLPFTYFRLSADSSRLIPIKQKEAFRLSNGHYVRLRVIGCNEDTPTIWVRWHDAQGNLLLDTRLEIVFNDAMVVAVDQEENQGVGFALAVKVSPYVTG